MKTPREILLAHHQPVAPKLDAIRQSTVAAVCDRRPPVDDSAAPTIFEMLWRELILPSRCIWSGLGAVWLLIVVFNVLEREPVSAGKGVSASPMMSFREEQRWMNELFADRTPPVEAEPPKITAPKPRTEIFQTFTT